MKNKFKKFIFLGYCSTKIRNILKTKNILSIISFNRRNTKNKNKINKLTKNEKNRYKKRIKIELNKICEINFTYFLINKKINFYKNLFSSEHIFRNLKSNHKLENRYERYINNYEGLLYLFFIKKICNN